jgi:hypothetical protein
LRVLNVLSNVLHTPLESDNSNRVGIRFSKDSTKTRNALSRLEVELFTEDLHILGDPANTDFLDLLEFRHSDTGFVREVETKLGRCNQRALLINMISKHLAESVIQDMGCSVVVTQRPATELMME